MNKKKQKAHRTIVRNRIIVFEGLDGAGKSSIIAKLAKKLTHQGNNVLVVANPYGMHKLSWTSKLHELILTQKPNALNQALLYLAIISENQYLYYNKKYDFVFIDRYLQSNLAYNVFYPALNPKPSQYRMDPNIIARSLIRLFKQSPLELEILPTENFIIHAEPQTFNLPNYDYEKLKKAYELSRPFMKKLYGYFGCDYRERIFINDFKDPKIIQDILKIITK